MPGRELQDEVRRIVDEAIDELRSAKLSKPARVATRVVLAAFKKRRGYDATMESVDQLRSDLAQIQAVLERCSESLRRAEQRVGDRSPGSEIWWNNRTRVITEALATKGERAQGLQLWRQTWVEGLSTGAWDRCFELAWLKEIPDSEAGLQDQMTVASEALRHEELRRALDPVNQLLAAPPRGVQWTAVLGVLRSRLLATLDDDREVTIWSARQTIDDVDEAARHGQPPDQDSGRWRSLALTGLAEVLLEFDELDEADKVLQEALEHAPGLADTLVAAGWLAERRQEWVDADQHYEAALAARPDLATSPRLLQPLPARLLLAAAADAPPEVAVPLLQQAINAGIAGDGDYPDRDAHLALAQGLTALAERQDRSGEPELARQSRHDAATAYVEAGNRFSWAGLAQRSIELFELAVASAPDVADHRWCLAEALRLSAGQPGGFMDTAALRRARDELGEGLRLEAPAPDDAWVLVTKAMIDAELPDSVDDPALTIERSLVLALDSPGEAYALGFGFLALALRRQGFLQEAYDAALQGDRVDSSEGMVVRQLLAILRDRGDYDEALERVESQLYRWPDDQELMLQKALTLARLERYEEAVSLLDQLDPTSYVRLERGLWLSALGDEEAARAELRALWLDTQEEDDPGIAGWSAYRIGELADAMEIYEPLVERAAADTPYARDFGQMLILHGDLDRGHELLSRGIDACPYADELVELRFREIPHLRRRLEDHDSLVQQRANRVLDEVEEYARRRIEELRTQRRPGVDLLVRAADARTALHSQRFDEALAIYVELARSGEFPEAPSGMRFAAELELEVADNICQGGDHTGALDRWLRLAEQLQESEAIGGSDLSRPLACRGALAAFQSGEAGPEQLALLADLLADAPEELAAAAQVLCSDIPHLWALDNALRAVLAEGRLEPGAHAVLQHLVDLLPISEVYGTKAAASDYSSYTYVPALSLRFGRAHENFAESGELSQGISGLQSRISDTVGVRIPWIYLQLADELAPDEVEFQLYERTVRSARFDPAAGDLVEQVVAFTEAAVLPNLFRTVGVDDVSLWLEGWDLTVHDAPAWEQTDPLADRLRLARVLRLLLREGVTVTDRPTIVGVLEASSRAGEQGTLRALRDVRMRLGRQAIGAPPGLDVAFLPDDLEARVASGLNDKGTVWELDRGAALDLVHDLRRWLGDVPSASRVVGVQDARVRPFVWRLLASEQPPVRVVAQEELS